VRELAHIVPNILRMVTIPGFIYSCVVRVLAHRVPKVLRMVTIPGFLTRKDLYRLSIIFKNLDMKTSLKLKINLIRPYYDLQIFPMKSKKRYKNCVRVLMSQSCKEPHHLGGAGAATRCGSNSEGSGSEADAKHA
jgi:hypothetical protein